MPTGPTLACDWLAKFDDAALDAARAAFAAAARCALRQAWLAKPQPELRPGIVRVGCRADELLVLAELDDEDAFSTADRPNRRAWELGDCFEMFLEAGGASHYVELHVTPDNVHTQLRIPIPRPKAEPETFMVEGDLFSSRVWKEAGRWTALAKIPFSSIGGRPSLFSFSRYDYTRGRAEPVLSSTSPHVALDFHRRQEWGTLTFS